MSVLLRIVRSIDSASDRVGAACSWLALLMVLLGAFNAIARYIGRSIGTDFSSNAYIEGQWYLFSLLFLLGAGYTLRHDGHVRVDVFYGRLSPRGKAWVDLVGTLLFLLPFCAVGLLLSWPSVLSSISVRELSPDPGGLPRYPLKAALLLFFVLLGLQGCSMAIRNFLRLRGHDGSDPEGTPEEAA